MPAGLRAGLAAAWPICLGYIPIGMAFGVLAQKAGLSPLEIGLMSLLVFAGSSQFIAVSMLVSGSDALPIVVTTFMVNLRHVLMSSALAVFLGGARRAKISLLAYGVTDESFAVNHPRWHAGDWDLNRALVVNHTANLAWIAATVVGGLGGQFIPAGAFGIDYALSAMFICLLVFQFQERIHVITALIAGVAAVGLSLVIPGNAHVILAAMGAATAGVVLKRAARKGARRRGGGHA